jgi:hypothetical protein
MSSIHFIFSKLHLIFFIIFVFLNCSKEKPVEVVKYSHAFPYTALYEIENESLKEIDRIPNRIKLITTQEMRFQYETFYEVLYNKKKGWVKESELHDKEGFLYFGVDTPKGINLREEPNQKSKTIDFLPFDTMGEVLKWNEKEETIQNKKGFWIQINFNKRKGWVFSGFLTIDKSLEKMKERTGGVYSELDFYRNFRNTKNISEANESDFSKEEISKLEIIESIDLNSYKILKLKQVKGGNEFKKVVFLNKENNRYYSFNTKDWMDNGDIIQFKNPLDSVILYNDIECCHGQISSYFIFFLKNKIVRIPFHPDTNGYCFMDAVIGGFSPFIKNRYNPQGKTIYTFAKHGKCRNDDDKAEIDYKRKYEHSDSYSYRSTPEKFTASQFIILKWDENSVTMEKYFEDDIPNKFKKDWDNSSEENNFIVDPSKFLDH